MIRFFISRYRLVLVGAFRDSGLMPYIWIAMFLNVTAFPLFLFPPTREYSVTPDMGCVPNFIGVSIERGMGLAIPGLASDVLGEIYDGSPTGIELQLTPGIWATGLFVFLPLT